MDYTSIHTHICIFYVPVIIAIIQPPYHHIELERILNSQAKPFTDIKFLYFLVAASSCRLGLCMCLLPVVVLCCLLQTVKFLMKNIQTYYKCTKCEILFRNIEERYQTLCGIKRLAYNSYFIISVRMDILRLLFSSIYVNFKQINRCGGFEWLFLIVCKLLLFLHSFHCVY